MDAAIEVMMDINSSQISGQGKNETMERSGITILSSRAGDYDEVFDEMMENPLDAERAKHTHSSVEGNQPFTSFYMSRVFFLLLTVYCAYATFSNMQLRQKISQLELQIQQFEQVSKDKRCQCYDQETFSSSSNDGASHPLLSIRSCYLEADFSLNFGDCAREKAENIVEIAAATKQGIQNLFKYASEQITYAYNELISEAYEADENNWWGFDGKDRKEDVASREYSHQNTCDGHNKCNRTNDSFNDDGKEMEHKSTLLSMVEFITVATLFAMGYAV